MQVLEPRAPRQQVGLVLLGGEHPKVAEATAIGVPHPSRGEQVKVFIVLKAGQTASAEDIIAYCKGKLATYKLPTEIEFLDDLPKTNVGKVLKKDLRAEELAKREHV